MELGIMIRWGSAKTGREREALESYHKGLAYGRRLVEENKLTYFEPFLFSGGDTEVEAGFFLAKGPVSEVFEILDSEEFREIAARAQVLGEHVHINMLNVGEGLDRAFGDYEKALTEVGL